VNNEGDPFVFDPYVWVVSNPSDEVRQLGLKVGERRRYRETVELVVVPAFGPIQSFDDEAGYVGEFTGFQG